jgi:hypothetical protein
MALSSRRWPWRDVAAYESYLEGGCEYAIKPETQLI